MFPDPERYQRRMKTKIASLDLIEPTKEVVTETRLLVDKGELDSMGRKKIEVVGQSTGRHYRIIDVEPEGRGPGDGGLFIGGFTKETGGERIDLIEIQLPRVPGAVTQENLFHIRGITVTEMRLLATDLRRG